MNAPHPGCQREDDSNDDYGDNNDVDDNDKDSTEMATRVNGSIVFR